MKVHKRAAAGICHDKEWAKGEQFHLCFHLKILVQEDTTQGCTISLSAAQGAPVNPFPPPAPSAHPRLQEWSHSGVTNVPVCSRVPMAPLLAQLLPCSPWSCGDFGSSSVPQCSLQPSHHTWGPSTQPRAAWGVPATPEKLDWHQGKAAESSWGVPTPPVSPPS